MASKRMFSLSVIDTDAFLEMPCSTQALYFHLCMRADDDGFVGSPKIITRTVGASEDDLKLLIAKRFVLTFEDGVIVIKHWRIHNTLSTNRYNETAYLEDKALLRIKPNKAYTFGEGEPLDDRKMIEASKRQTGDKKTVDGQKTDNRRTIDAQKTNTDKIRIDKNRIEEKSIEEDSIGEYEGETKVSPRAPKETKKHFGEYKHVLLTETEFGKLCTGYGEELTKDCITFLDEYIEMKGYKAKSHYLCVIKWVVDAVKERKAKQERQDEPRKSKAAQELDDFYKMGAEWVAKKKGENA